MTDCDMESKTEAIVQPNKAMPATGVEVSGPACPGMRSPAGLTESLAERARYTRQTVSGADLPFSLEFCPRLKRMFESRVVETSDGKTAPFEAGSTVNNIQILRHLVMALRPTRTLEIGLAHGASALTFLTSLREINAGGGDFLHTAIDPFQRTVWKSAALHAIAVDGFRDHFQFHDEESSIALPRLCDEHREFQLIYIDGSHLFEDVFLDFAFTARLLPIGGLCLFDDCSDRHVQKVIRFIKTNYRDVLRRYPLEGLVKKPLLKRLANRIGFYQLAAFEKIAQTPRKWDSAFTSF
jgi:predicted O-methyltransferase YrrM